MNMGIENHVVCYGEICKVGFPAGPVDENRLRLLADSIFDVLQKKPVSKEIN